MFHLLPPVSSESSIDADLSAHPVLANATASSPYLQRLCRYRPETLQRINSDGAETTVRNAIECANFCADGHSVDEVKKTLRHCKSDIHLSLASLDLSCTWDWDPVTRTFSEFADKAADTALRAACFKAAESGWIEWSDRDQPVLGLFLLALGKHGAMELNYSSDIDIIAMYDPDIFPSASRSAGDAAVRIIQLTAQILEQQTEHGYVLRVDLRLRPDPRSTPVAVSTHSADLYYESVGQNWKRMAYIKARPCAGDTVAADAFLKELEPFIWRRHLDFWALEDIRAIKNQIHSTGGHKGLENPEFDVKLGRGGIREIEFFAQTQQLIHGGRHPELRNRRTVDALEALAADGHVASETASELAELYGLLRGIEHRVQMLNDDHTHTLSHREEQRERVAHLCGYAELAAFDSDVREMREKVHTHYSALFHSPDQLPGVEGNLVFTGVDIDPGTVETLESLGFSDAKGVIADVQSWHRGKLRATKTQRSRQLLTALEARLFQLMSETGNPDAAFDGFKTFLAGLSGGVQTLSLFTANPVILDDLIAIFSMAPRLARDLASNPNLIESLLDGGFTDDIREDTCGYVGGVAAVQTNHDLSFEDAMNEVRRNFRDAHFRIRFRLLNDAKLLADAGHCFSDLADTCIRALEPHAIKAAEASLGPASGKWVICGLGKLGNRDLTARSDLDLMVIYDPDEGASSAANFFTRATQRLITSLSAQTEEGLLYEADMQLRPSGRAGPVAVRLSAFADYYRNDAWTWEHMALTRLRVIAGDPGLADRVMAEKQAQLSLPRPKDMLIQDAWDMRQRLLKERPPKNALDVKLAKGGMMDVEFLAQTAQLVHPEADWGDRTLETVLPKTVEYGLLSDGELRSLMHTYVMCRGLQAYQRAALDRAVDQTEWPEALKRITAKALNVEDFEALLSLLFQQQEAVWSIFCKQMQPETTEWISPSR
ncbi:MAG: bifunctional [glutamate--ammonia ligase]-adenylyl-L-tyrosine phosphorylase/[glutamate--ammonia-ligase] adenylyltransferase [Ponticaulis sp.]|nr:bifunctional [glutamate--ammonia ligase]-adenylyl-L-tyrosine phosphorylase/[glutamate--ammonia-ligase] adenylyltransferase [Ponticaulis sp.]